MNINLPVLMVLGAAALSSAAISATEKELPKKEVPQAVREAFQKAYPGAKGAKYSKESEDGKTLYEVEFKEKGKEIEAVYKADGSLYETEEEIDIRDLPEQIVQAIKKAHPEAVLKEAEKITGSDGKPRGYEVEVKVGKKELELELTADGNIVKTEEEDD